MVLFSACALCATLALAPSPSPSPTAVPEIAHVYTTDRSDETLKNATRTTYVVTHDQIARNGYRTVAQALQGLPGMEVSPYGALGNSANYEIRGANSAQVLVLVDGLPAPGSFSNSVELGSLPTTGVDRIEVVEGGGSTLYGTGAIGGIINIITQRSTQNSATLAIGSFGQKRLEVATDHVQFSRVLAANDFALPGGAVRPDADYESSALHLDDTRHIGAFDLAMRAGLQADHLGAPGPFGFESPTSRQDDVNTNANISAVHKGAQSESTLQFGGTHQQILFACDPANDPNCFQPSPSLNTEGRVDFSARNVVSGAGEQLLYGVDLSRGTVRMDSGGASAGPAISVNAIAQAAAYVQNKIATRSGNFYYGVRGERDGALGGELSPSAGMLLHLSSEATFKANIATAFRAPNASELYFPGYGNPLLVPERAKVMDASLVDSHVLGGVSLGWFSNRTNDLIVATPVKAGTNCIIDSSSFTYEPCNVGHAFVQGLVLDVRTPRERGFTTALNLTDLYRAQDLDTGTRLPNQPAISANLRLDYSAGAQSIVDSWGAWIHLASARGAVDETKPLFYQPAAYTSVNAYVRMRAGHDALVTLRGYNLGNERYAAVAGFPMPGRSFVVELSTK